MVRILALEPYYGGSHRAFLDGWSGRSRHEWTILGLPAYKWKWRMRHGAITLAQHVAQRVDEGQSWDLLFCSDMLNLAEFLGLAPEPVRRLPSVVYFHENQLTYPVQVESERDWHFAFTNITTALAAGRVWFNSAFHRDEFLTALPVFLRRMPDYQPLDIVDRIANKAEVHSPGIDEFPTRGPREPGPLRILWAARWEHDKNPDAFFEALKLLKQGEVPFRVSVIGQRFRDTPPVFDWAREYFADHIDRWGYQESTGDYKAALTESDVIVSTADHEFFGLSVLEAVAAGCRPLVPYRLAYPEILDAADPENRAAFFYNGPPETLADRLTVLAEEIDGANKWQRHITRALEQAARFAWTRRAKELDQALD